jgi:hypothetical protein
VNANSTTGLLPRKPRPDFPLFPHATGRWAKKVRGKLHYFGKTADDPKGEAALNQWLLQKNDLLAGRKPRTQAGGLEVRDLCNQFLTAKTRLLKSGEITPRTFDDDPGAVNGELWRLRRWQRSLGGRVSPMERVLPQAHGTSPSLARFIGAYC